MKEITAIKLKRIGIKDGYNGFDYLVAVLERYGDFSIADLSMKDITSYLAKEFSVSEKAVLHNLTLVFEKSWSSDNSPLRMAFSYSREMPTLKEFIATLIVVTECSA